MNNLSFSANIHTLSFFKALNMLQLGDLLATYPLQTCDEKNKIKIINNVYANN